MQGQTQRGGLAGGRRGFGGPSDRGGNKQDSSQLASVQNRPNMLDIAGPVAGPVAGTTTSPNQGSNNQMGIVNPAVLDLALTPSLDIFNQGGGGMGGIEMSTAPVAAAPEPIPEETNPLINFFNKRIVNPYVDAVYNYGLPLSQFTPTQFGLISLYGNMFNFNPTKDEETGEISTSNLGEVGTATFGKLNLDNYENAEEVNPQDFYGAAFDFDDEGNFEGTNFEKLEKFTEEEGLSLKPGMDLEQNLIDNREFGGDGPQKQFVPPSTSLAEEGAASATDPQQPAPTTPTDAVNLDAVYSGLSDAEKATVDKIVEMDDYDLPYALTYVLYGGPLF
tara:strand:+ start:6318 stop:7319 length:1002 start_codon:yes stop_codon:yes gene_type:complete